MNKDNKVPKVLMVNTVPMIYDGITMTILNYVSNMDRSDIQVDFVAINHLEERLRKQILELGSKVYELTDRNTHQFKYIKELASVVKNGGYNVVHIHCNSCTATIDLLGAKLGGATLRCPHSHNTKCAHNTINKALRPLFNILYTDGFACGKEAGKWLYGKGEFLILKNATNTDKYKFNEKARAEFRAKYKLEGKIAVGHVAHFTYHKNHPFLIDFFKEVVERDKRYVLFLIGDGKFKELMMTKVKDYGIENNVVFVGTTLDIPQYLSMMDMMVLPSLYEGLPNVVIEWQISGLPILVADTVTPDCKLTDSVKFLPLTQDKWVNSVLECNVDIDRKEHSERNIKLISDAGFDIKKQAALLKQYYIEHLNQ